ncbi:AcrR family transcriptional regulator [Marinoscillum sp. 108]|nr:AcrR family transcriptional regulator [Marinoscillum sp. 108]
MLQVYPFMEKTATKTRKKSLSQEDFKLAYMDHVLTHGSNPASVFAFAKDLKSTEAQFYSYFNSFKALERTIWSDWFAQTIKTIEEDPAYAEYTVREKLLGFYFTWLEILKNNRSFVLKRFEEISRKELNPYFLEGVQPHFKSYVNDLVTEGKDTTEVAERPFTNQYEKAFWLHFLFITRFWVNDDSSDFEKTDAAIEKSVNLAFDLVGKGPLDSMLDFAKFLFQNK